MNKYQEAYYLIRIESLMQCSGFSINRTTNKFECTCGREEQCQNYIALQTLKELVDKATSTKPNIWGDGVDSNGEIIYDMYDCPNCDKSYEIDYEKYDYCPNCGQRLDWSGVDENV